MKPEVKIDKRTKAYKDSLLMPSEKVLSEPSVTGISPTPPPPDNGDVNRVGCHKCGSPDPDLIVISPSVSICRSCLGELNKETVTPASQDNRREDAKSGPDYAKSKDNPGFRLCMHCGNELPPNDDGSPKWRGAPELCNPCVWRNDKKKPKCTK